MERQSRHREIGEDIELYIALYTTMLIGMSAKMAETQMEKTELKFLGGLFRNKSKKGDIYYSGKSEDGTSWVLFRNAYWKEGEENKPYFRLHQRVPLGSVVKTDD